MGVDMNRVWEKPELVVLEKCRPEEQVLANCKYGALTGPDSANSACKQKPGPVCLDCHSEANS